MLTDNGTPGVTHRFRVAVHSLRQAINEHAGRIVVAERNGIHLIAGCLLDEDLVPIPLWKSVVRMLLEAGYSPWGVWVWIATPTTWLDNETPAELIHADPDRVFRAVEDKLLATEL